MKQRSLSKWLLAFLGAAIVGSLFFFLIGSNDHEAHSFARDEHARFNGFDHGMMSYSEHFGHHHNFEVVPMLCVLFMLTGIIWLIYKRYKKNQTNIVDGAAFSSEAISPARYNKADFLDEWEKNAHKWRKNEMRIFKRIKHMAIADVHHFLDSFENPISMIKQYMRDMEEELDNAQHALANQLLTEKRYETLISRTNEVVTKRARQAGLAVDRGEESIALIALQEKINAEEKLEVYREQQRAVKEQTTQLTEELNRLAEVYSELQTKKQYLLSRANAAQAIERVNTRLHPFNTDQVERGFARMEEKIWRMETGVEASRKAHQMLTSVSGAKDLVTENAKRELEKLKAERTQS